MHPPAAARTVLTSLLLTLALVAAACDGGGPADSTVAATTSGPAMTAVTSTTAPTTTTTTAATTTTDPITTTTTTTIPILEPGSTSPIPVDGDVRIGTLDNGLTYYVRYNDSPGLRAQLRLVVNAGSALEDEDQSGAAHFVEHMLFNGTERYPVNDLIDVLESFGMRFGPDVNAYTSYDETVYELALPTDDRDTFITAFDVLLEWAARATIAPEDVIAERGVIVEEWRERDQGISGRIDDTLQDLLLTGTPYQGRAPIGEIAAIESTGADTLRRFYEDWYRPDLIAVVAVGDFDVDEVVGIIKERFDTLPAATGARERTVFTVDPADTPRAGSLADPDLPSAFASILFPTPAAAASTVGDLRDRMAVDLAFQMIADRLTDQVSRGEAPFFGAESIGIPFVRALSVPGLEVETDGADLVASVETVLTEVERARRHGFGAGEFERAVGEARRNSEQEFAGRETTQDWEYADAYVEHFLNAEPILNAKDRFQIEQQILGALDAATAHAALYELLAGTPPAVLAVGPEAAGASIPDPPALLDIVAAVAATDIPPLVDEGPGADVLMDRPEPAEIVDRSDLPYDAVEITLANGARVLMMETLIAENTIVFQASSPGGASLVTDENLVEAYFMPDVVFQSGVGPFDQVALDRLLSGEVVELSAYVEETAEGMFGRAATEDLETLLQLIHRYMTAPRATPAGYDAAVGPIRPYVENPEQVPDLAATVALFDARYGGDPRFAYLPTVEDLDTFDLDAGLDEFSDRFGDAGDFVFAFSGDFETAVLEDLVQRYLGTLPAGEPEEWVDLQPDPPPGPVVLTVEAGLDEQGAVTFLITGEVAPDLEVRIHAELLERVVESRLRDRLREALSATYSPYVNIETADQPDEIIETYLQISADPDRLEEISVETLAALAALRDQGPTAPELAAAKEQLIREYELVSNEFWVETMLFYAGRPGADMIELGLRFTVINATTAADLAVLATIAFPEGQYVEVRQVPEG